MKTNRIIRSISIITLLLLSALLPIGCRSKAEESGKPEPKAETADRQSYARKGIRPQKARFSRKIED